MENKAFDLIAKQLEGALAEQGFVRQPVDVQDENGSVALYIGEPGCYSVFYDQNKKRFELRTCKVVDEEPDNNWKAISVWLFDPENDSEREAEGIAADFVETVQGPKRKAAVQAAKKKKKGDENNVDPLFLMNRLVNVLPDLKDEIKYEKEHYERFRGVTFAKEQALPRIRELLLRGDRNACQKLGEILSACYGVGDLDARGVITMVLLNNIEGASAEILEEALSDELKKAWKNSVKMKGKNIKPEKKKKKQKKFMGDTLNSRGMR